MSVTVEFIGAGEDLEIANQMADDKSD